MPVSSVLEVPYNVALAISLASNATGVDFDYLVRTAAQESNFQTSVRAKTSSAQGLYQFIEETWLRTIKEEGARFGLDRYAKRIFRTRNGRYYVPEARERKKILALRNDPKISAMMAGAFAHQNAQALREGIGRKPTAGELYIAHFLGARSAVKLIKLSKAKPSTRASKAFPAAARANRRIFYRNGRPRTARQVYQLLARKYDKPATAQNPTVSNSWNTLVVNRQEAQANSKTARRRKARAKNRNERRRLAAKRNSAKPARLAKAKRISAATPQLRTKTFHMPGLPSLRGSLEVATASNAFAIRQAIVTP